jgi:hypothetical protein
MASLPASYALKMLRWPLTRTTRLLPLRGARWKPSDLSKESKKVLRSESRVLYAWIYKPSIQDATEYISIDAESDTGESTRSSPSSSFSFESDAPLRYNKHTWHYPVFHFFLLFTRRESRRPKIQFKGIHLRLTGPSSTARY